MTGTQGRGVALVGMGLGLIVAALLVHGWSSLPPLPAAEASTPAIVIGTVVPAPPVPEQASVMPLLLPVTVVVPPGLTATEIAQLMVAAGVLDDAWDFVERTVRLRVDRLLRAGTYEFCPQSTPEQVLSALVFRP